MSIPILVFSCTSCNTGICKPKKLSYNFSTHSSSLDVDPTVVHGETSVESQNLTDVHQLLERILVFQSRERYGEVEVRWGKVDLSRQRTSAPNLNSYKILVRNTCLSLQNNLQIGFAAQSSHFSALPPKPFCSCSVDDRWPLESAYHPRTGSVGRTQTLCPSPGESEQVHYWKSHLMGQLGTLALLGRSYSPLPVFALFRRLGSTLGTCEEEWKALCLLYSFRDRRVW